MRRWRYGLVTAGVLVLLYGAGRLAFELPGDVPGILLWLVAVVVIHDGVLSPLVVGIGWILARTVPARARRYLQATLVIGGMLAVIAAPMIYRQGSEPVSKALLLQNYAANLAALLGLVAALNLIAYTFSALRRHPTSSPHPATAAPGNP